jgi:hypothetical protein
MCGIGGCYLEDRFHAVGDAAFMSAISARQIRREHEDEWSVCSEWISALPARRPSWRDFLIDCLRLDRDLWER